MNTYLFREVRGDDVRAIFELTKGSGYHSNNLPQNFDLIERDVYKSVRDFEEVRTGAHCKNPLFIFVLEDTENSKVVGVSLVKDVSYRLLYSLKGKKYPGMNVVGNLALQKECNTFELGGFLLSKNLRGGGLEKLLSYGCLLFLLCMDLSPREIVTGFRMANDFFWDWVGKDATNGLPITDAYMYWRDIGQLYHFLKDMPAHFFLATNTELSIHPDAAPAQHLLEKMGLRFLDEIEANGSLWYGASWQKVRRTVLRSRISPARIKTKDACCSCHSDTAFIAANKPDGFFIRSAFVQTARGGFLRIGRDDAEGASLEQVFLF